MVEELQIQVLPPHGLINDQEISVFECIRLFENGAENIYLTDANGVYRFRAIAKDECRLVSDEQKGWTLSLKPFEPIVFSMPVSGKTISYLQQVARPVMERNSGKREFLVVDSGGAAVCVLRTKETENEIISWQDIHDLPDELRCRKIYVSCMSNPLLKEFSEMWQKQLKIEELSPKNYQQVFGKDSDGLLLYEADIFPACPKMEVHELYQRLVHGAGACNLVQQCMISEDWAEMTESEMNMMPALLAYFDQGYQSVHISNSQEEYIGTITLTNFQRTLAAFETTVKLENLSSEFDNDEVINKSRAAVCMAVAPKERLEVPMLSRGAVKAVVSSNYGIKGFSRRDLWKIQPLYWELIGHDTIQTFFREKKYLLLSSSGGLFTGFMERFCADFKIESMSDTRVNVVSLYTQSKADILLYGAEIWPHDRIAKYNIRQLYVDLLAEEIQKYFLQSGVCIYWCDVSKPVDGWQQRIAEKKEVGTELPVSAPVLSGMRGDYIVPADTFDGKHVPVRGGRRQDVPRLSTYERSVYIFGPCLAFGCAAPYGETIEARLQEKLLASGRKWRVVNCGGFGSRDNIFNDLNCLNRIMDLHARTGDVVIHFSQSLWRNQSTFKAEHFYLSSDAFDDARHRQGKYWQDSCMAHLYKDGYDVWSSFLADKLLSNTDLHSIPAINKQVRPFAEKLQHRYVRPPELKKYLAELNEHKHEERGAIVMNANPFTLGHLYLIEEARRQVDFLYVFVVEEDKSEIPFTDRLAIVRRNCHDMPAVEVLPSGQYMISALTFQDYFEKEERQDVVVCPSFDIQIFGEAIAPVLGITKRFVGEEPLDKVTRQYNEAMKVMLPDYGVELIEIPRKTAADGKAINATQVRTWLHAGKLDECQEYLPQATLEYLRRHNPLYDSKRESCL